MHIIPDSRSKLQLIACVSAKSKDKCPPYDYSRSSLSAEHKAEMLEICFLNCTSQDKFALVMCKTTL